MFILPACMFLLVRVTATRPTEKTDSATPGDVKVRFQLDSPIAWEEHLNFSSVSCDEIRTWTSTTLRLQNQSLMSFPDCLPELLEHLDLSVNLLPELKGQHIAYLPKLQVLSLRQNQILQVIWGGESLSSLQFMDLSFNLLSFVPACMTTSLDNLRWLSLAGNPITEIQPFAFSCYPQLHFLNLSSTWLGKNGKEGIQESAFALKSPHNGDSDEEARHAAISMLDLSATFLERIHQDWIKDLPRLTSFYLTKMSKLRSLDSAVFHSVPMLRELDCRDSHALSVIETESFNHVPDVAVLIFKNCNLSFFNPWNLTSSNTLVVNLYGNPLICHCAITWLFSKPDKVVLQRASETMCYFSPENKETSSSGSKMLSKLNDECQDQATIHSASSIIQDKFYSTSASITRDAQPISSTLPQKSYSDSFTPQSTPFTWGDVTKQDLTRADILAYKEQNTSTNHPLTTVDFQAVFSTILREISTEQTFVNTVEMDKIKQEATPPHQSASPSVTSEVTGPTSSELSNSLLIPLSTADSNWNNLPLQDGTETTSHPKLAPTNHPIYYADDYDYENNQVASVTQIIGLCDYDPCRHLQKPCTDLQKTSPCLCPGMSDEFTIPDPPRFREISETRDTSAQIHWCSPNSAVRSYQLVYRLKSSKNYTVAGEIYATARRYTLYNLLPGSTYQVCIIASNKAGSSQTTGWNEYNTPCSTFVTKSSYRTIFAALCATSGLFLIATILLSVCLCKKCKTPHIEQYNTHLVSYKNPAFDYSLK